MKSLITLLFLILFSFTNLSAQQVITGTHRPQERPGFSQYNWTFRYEFFLDTRGEGKGTISWRVVENTMELSDGAVFFDMEGKQYHPSDLSLNSWPNYKSSDPLFQGTLHVLYKGSVVKTYRGFNKNGALGTFYAGKDYEWSAMVGSAKILFANFNIADFSMEVVSYENSSKPGTPETNRLINERNFANRPSGGKSTEAQFATSSSGNFSTVNPVVRSSNNPGSTSSSRPSSTSSGTSSSNYSSGGLPGSSSVQLQQQRDQAVVQLAELSVNMVSDIASDIRKARERKAQLLKQQQVSDSIKKAEEFTAWYNERKRNLSEIIDQNEDKAETGDLEARLSIIAGTIRYDGSDDITTKHLQWLDEGVKDNNIEAILYKAALTHNMKLYQKAADLGSVDAMVILGEHYNGIGKYDGNSADSAFYWFERAANAGCPKAAYFLGMIYQYGNTAGEQYADYSHMHDLSPSKEYVVTYSIPKDLTKSFDWFGKSIKKRDYLIFEIFRLTRFAEAINADLGTYMPKGSVAPASALWELANMYKKGIGVEKNKKMAEACETLYSRYWNNPICFPNYY